VNIYNSNCFVNDVLILKRKILKVSLLPEIARSSPRYNSKKTSFKGDKFMKLTSSAFEQVEKAMEGHILANAQLMGRYKRLS